MSFTEARHEVLANNISNFDTVGYQARDLPVAEFQEALSAAVARREQAGAGAGLALESTRHLRWDGGGRLASEATPVRGEEGDILYHDRNNRFVEKQMSELAQNGLLHNVAAELLRSEYGLLQTAIRGRL